VVNAWIDFDANGHWMEPYDQIITNAVLASGAIHTLTFLVPATAKTGYTYTRFRIANHGGLTPEGPAEDGEVEDYRIEVGQAGSDVVARHVFYNNSVWDGNNPAANSSDDGAIAPDKAVFLPVGPVLPANSSGYSKGINGIMVDIDNPGGTATVGDFGIRVNSASAPNTWSVGPVPVVSVRSGDGVGGSDRVTLVWPDGAILNQWIEVTVLSDANGGGLGLVDNDLFYFGNCVADVNGDGGVNSSDYGMLAGQFGRRGGIGELDADLNGDGRVDLNDFAAMRGAKGNSVPAPIFPAASPAAPTMGGGVGLDVPSATAEAASVAPETMNPETATAPALSVDLLVIPSMTDYIEDAPTRSGGAATRRPYREAAGQYDLRPLGDDPDAGAQGDDLLADILAESPLAPGL